MKCIYLRTNTINGKQYVGQANDFDRREQDWKCDSRYSGGVIDKARNKYGIESFETKVLRECETKEELNYWEQYYIKELNTKVPNGYNLTDGGEGTVGIIVSDETRKKSSISHKGQHSSPQTEIKKGQHIGKEFKKGHTPWNKGKKGVQSAWNKGTKGVIKAWNKGVPMTEEQKEKLSKKVYQYTFEGEFVREWKSVSECKKNGYNNISACCNGKIKKAYGYIWSYTKKEDIN